MIVKSKKFSIPWIIIQIIMVLMLFVSILPIWYVFVQAFKPSQELVVFPPKFYVVNPTLSNFSDLFSSLSSLTVPFSRSFFNSLFTTAASIFGTVIVCAWAAYALSKFNLKGQNVIFNLIVAALMFSPHVTQIPNYMVVSGMGLIDTYGALILPKIAVAYNIFLMKQFVDQIPNSMLESARMDGAGEWKIFWKIVMPSAAPAWSTLIVFSFISNWNDYISPLLFTTKEQMKTLSLAIQNIGTSIARLGATEASRLVMILPTILIFLIMQKKVVETMIHSGIKS